MIIWIQSVFNGLRLLAWEFIPRRRIFPLVDNNDLNSVGFQRTSFISLGIYSKATDFFVS